MEEGFLGLEMRCGLEVRFDCSVFVLFVRFGLVWMAGWLASWMADFR